MSTAAHERRAGQRMRGSGMHILAYYTYFAYSAKVKISKEAYRKILVGINIDNEWLGIEKSRETACWHRMQWVQQDFCLAVSL